MRLEGRGGGHVSAASLLLSSHRATPPRRTVAEALTNLFKTFKPDLVIYDAGVDVHVCDSLGRLALTDDGLRRRDLLVLDTCLAHEVPVAGLVGGGYHDDLAILADRHCHLHRAAAQMWDAYGLGH